MLEACMLTSSRSGDADSVDRQSFLVLFRVREMYPWAFCPACHLVPLWSLLHTLCPIWAAGLGKGEKDLLQAPNCIKLSNKALLSLKEKRIKNSCYIYSGQKKAPFTHNRESFFLDRAMPTTAFSFLFSLYPPILQRERPIIVCPKKWLVKAQKLFLILDNVLPCLLCVGLFLKWTHGKIFDTVWPPSFFKDFRIECKIELLLINNLRLDFTAALLTLKPVACCCAIYGCRINNTPD